MLQLLFAPTPLCLTFTCHSFMYSQSHFRTFTRDKWWWTWGWISVPGCGSTTPETKTPINTKANILKTQLDSDFWVISDPQKSIPNLPKSLRRAQEVCIHSSPWVQPLETRSPCCMRGGLPSLWGFSCCSQLSAWKKASAICFSGREYGITVNYIEKLDSFTAVIIDLPICLGELAAGKKIKRNLDFCYLKRNFNLSTATHKELDLSSSPRLPVLRNIDIATQEMTARILENSLCITSIKHHGWTAEFGLHPVQARKENRTRPKPGCSHQPPMSVHTLITLHTQTETGFDFYIEISWKQMHFYLLGVERKDSIIHSNTIN